MKSFNECRPWQSFLTYDPYLTFSNDENDGFISSDGKTSKELNPDTEALFNIGLEAFNLLSKKNTRDEFIAACKSHFLLVNGYKELLKELVAQNVLETVDEFGNKIDLCFDEINDSEIIDLVWKIESKKLNNIDDKIEVDFIETFAYHSLWEIDNAMVGMALDGRAAIASAIAASNALSNAVAIKSRESNLIEARRELAYRGALAKIKKDPKQQALLMIAKEYQMLKSQFKRRGYSAQFVREMHDKYPIITSIKTIEKLVAELNKQNELIPR